MDYFRNCFLMLCCITSLVLANTSFAANEPPRTIVGYSSELSVRPGDTVDFMVNSVGGEKYDADLVRVINGESRSIYGGQFKVEYTKSSFERTYDGSQQELNLGSYIHVGNTAALDQLESFTVSGWIYPVFDPTGYTPPDLENPDPFHPPTLTMAPLIVDNPQTVVSRFDATTQLGWALRLNPEMQLEFAVGDGKGPLTLVTIDQKLQDWGWSYVAITFYADDLYDAEWSTDFSFTIPNDLESGVYAARLTQGDFVEYITFFVAAPKGKPVSRLAFWVSDYNYLAYAGISLGVTAKKNYPSHNWNEPDLDFMRENPEYGQGGVYNTHVDGRNFAYGSRLRPDLGMKPGALTYNFTQDTHVTAFLEHFGFDYDVITDELVDEEGLTLLDQYEAIITSTHPEYVTTGMSSGPFVGVECSAMIFNGSSAYRRLPDSENSRSAWIFEGTTEGPVFGDYGIDRVHGGAAGFEIDKFNPSNGTPRHALNLATSEPLKETIEEVKMSVAPLSIYYTPASPADHGQADIVFFETPKGGAVTPIRNSSSTWH